MTMAEVQVKEWGNSLGFIIPKDIVRHENLNKGETVKIDIIKEKRIDGFGMLKGAPSFKREKEEHDEF
jgi:hypothetical protein|tara:strand:+ start:116 stop:319 length:204 start_codon:yes stop_codon:yes gene_type:complete